ncbi:MAG: hypothetical protein M3R65_00275 [Gemmatimonadota bacterium]|nr:hypothetical protein [Gemmatimonadota bacterium]
MPRHPQRSLRHQYELYVENEIETYKESLPRRTLLKLGDEAVGALCDEQQLALTELVVWEEVDRIISKRLRLVSYETWRRKRLKEQRERQRPEHWGFSPDCALAREVRPPAESNVLVSGDDNERVACYLAAHGYEVFAVGNERAAIQRIVNAAEEAGLLDRVHGYIADLRQWSREVELSAVVCSPSAFTGLSEDERREVIGLLQDVTRDGGVHLVSAGGDEQSVIELSTQYCGWQVSVEHEGSAPTNFVARKGAA